MPSIEEERRPTNVGEEDSESEGEEEKLGQEMCHQDANPERADEKDLFRNKIRYQKRALFFKNATL